MIEFVLLVHLAGASPQRVDAFYPDRPACVAAGREWLRGIRHRSPNDHIECIPISTGEPVSMWFPKGRER
jgi:hypothetical protein